MTATARTATRRIAAVTTSLVESVIASLACEFDDCQMCGHPAAYLYDRLTEDGDEVRACETCVDTLRLGHIAD